MEDVSRNGSFSEFPRTFLDPPKKKKILARPAGPREPRRGSRDGLKLVIDRPLEATTVPVWLEMFL